MNTLMMTQNNFCMTHQTFTQFMVQHFIALNKDKRIFKIQNSLKKLLNLKS